MNVTSGLHWSHCTDLNLEGKFSCNSEDLWSSEVMNVRRGVYNPYVRNLPKLKFATDLLEPNDGYIEPCFTLLTNPNDPENFTHIPKEAVCLDPKRYLCRKEIDTNQGAKISTFRMNVHNYNTNDSKIYHHDLSKF